MSAGIASTVVTFKQLAERVRRTLLGARLMGVQGEVRREAVVTYLVATAKHLPDRAEPQPGRRADLPVGSAFATSMYPALSLC
jgi:hypothetical protein